MQTTLNVEGMTCDHCVKAITGAVGQLNGVNSVDVDLGAKTVTVSFAESTVTVEQIKEAIEEQGYDIVS